MGRFWVPDKRCALSGMTGDVRKAFAIKAEVADPAAETQRMRAAGIATVLLALSAGALSACAGEYDPGDNTPFERPFPSVGPGDANVPAQNHMPPPPRQ